MVLKCAHVWDRISEYIDGTLPAEVLLEVQLHLEHCELCSAILDSTHNILVLVADDRVFHLPLRFSQRLHERIEDMLRDKLDLSQSGPPG